MAKSVTQSAHQAANVDRRGGSRKDIGQKSSVRFTEIRAEIIVDVRDISAFGCRITTSRALPLGTEVVVGLGGAGSVNGRIINQRQNDYGIEFEKKLGHEVLGSAFSGTQIISLFANRDLDQSSVEKVFSIRSRLAIIATLSMFSWLSVIGMAVLSQKA